jgi:hypothetical protein
LPTKYKSIHPEKVIFVDETGEDAAKNGNRGGQKFLTTWNSKARERWSTKDCHFTVLLFKAATGEPVMCAVIVAKKGPLTMEERIGFNAMAQLEEQDELDLENIDKKKFCDGKDKVFPYKPTVTFNGEKGGCITTEELTLMLNYMDELGLIERSDRIYPMVIFDGRISRIMGPFLEYVNNLQHWWRAMLDIPYGTHLWQVRDSAEQNGAFKIAMTKWKRWLRQQKADFGLQQTIEKTDSMLLLTLVWDESFAIVENNKNACANRGWNHWIMLWLSMKIWKSAVSHAAILAFNYGTALVDPATLNMEEGFSETIFNRMVDTALKKIQEAGADLTLLAAELQATACKRIVLAKQFTPAFGFLDMAIILGQQLLKSQTWTTKIENRLS